MTRRRRLILVVLLAGLAGCSLGAKPGLQVTIRNHTDAAARIEMVEFDFATGEAGAAIGDPTSLAAGASTRLQLRIPEIRDWALLINDNPGVTSLGLAQAEQGLPGQGALSITVDVRDGGLEIQTDRGQLNGGVTEDPAPN